MTKRALLTALLGLVLVLGLTTSSFAAWYIDSGSATNYTSGSTWSSGTFNVPVPDSMVPGSTSPYLRLNFNLAVDGTWTGSESITLNVIKDGSVIDTIVVNPLHPVAGGSSTAEYVKEWITYGSGVYELQAVSSAGTGDLWHLTSASFSSTSTNPTPLPAAVWMLGSGLLGIAGFKRFRKNPEA